MRRNKIGALAALGAMMFGVQGLAADCAPHISGGGPNDDPLTGDLIGESTRTESIRFDIAGKYFGVDRGTSETFSVGFYRMNNGQLYAVDCRTYTILKM